MVEVFNEDIFEVFIDICPKVVVFNKTYLRSSMKTHFIEQPWRGDILVLKIVVVSSIILPGSACLMPKDGEDQSGRSISSTGTHTGSCDSCEIWVPERNCTGI